MITTDRLILRQWKKEDLEPFAALNADPRVMEFFPKLHTREESAAFINKASSRIEEKGWGFWAACLKDTGEFIGFIGLENVYMDVPFTPAVEIGWRLAFDYWGKGYATEGAQACLQYAFEELNLDEIVAFTAVNNKRSRAVMERLCMHHNPQDDFDHPNLSPDHPLRRHVLYRLRKIK